MYRTACAAVVVMLAVGPVAARATDLIVDGASPAAADGNLGVPDKPFKTIQAAVDKAQPGDVVVVKAGVYREGVLLKNSGQPGKPITLKSETKHGAVLTGADVITAWKSEGAGVWSMSDPKLQKFQHNETHYGNGQWIYVDGYPLERAMSREKLAPGGFWHDFEGKKVWVMPEEGRDIKELKVEYAHRDGLINCKGPLTDIVVSGFKLVQNHSSQGFRGAAPINIVGQRWTVEENHIAWTSYNGMNIGPGCDIAIRNNLIEWAGNTLITGSRLNRMIVEGNTLRYGNWRRMNPNHEGGTSKWTFTLNSIIRNNDVSKTFGYGLWTDIHNYGNIYEGNICHDNTMGATIFTEISSGDIIRNNVIYNNADGITVGESPNTLVMNNLVFNNDVGIRMRGNFRRNNGYISTAANNGPNPDSYENYRKTVSNIPGISEMEVEQHMARFQLFWRAPRYHMSNSSYLESNLIFDNGLNYFEHRDYAKPSAIDPFINNFSNYNLYWSNKPSDNIGHAGGRYADFATWQRVSGRDEKSVFADPRNPETKLPEWAEAKKEIWSRSYRSPQAMKELKLGLIDSPMTAELVARIRRSKEVRPLEVADGQIRAMVIDVEGEPTLAVWLSQTADRRYVQIDPDAASVKLENGYGGVRDVPASGKVEIVATHVPTYVRGIGKGVKEVRGSSLTAQAFNMAGQAVPIKAVFVNDSATPQELSVTFSGTEGLVVEPASISRTLAAGEQAEITLAAKPSASFVGSARVLMSGTLGSERIARSATFASGEGGGALITARTAPAVDGDLAEWKALGDKALLGTITSPEQFSRGDRLTWNGPRDSSAKVFGVWTKDAIYLAAEVQDDEIFGTAPGSPPYANDAIEFFLDGRASDMQWQVAPTEGVYQVAIGPSASGDKPAVEVLSPTGSLTGLETAVKRTATGYVVEIKVPLTPQSFPARDWRVGRTIKLSALLNDRDDAAVTVPENVLGWSFSPRGKNHADTSGWKTMVLE